MRCFLLPCGSSATPGEVLKRRHGPFEFPLFASTFFPLSLFDILLLLLLRVTPHQIQGTLKGPAHAAHPACNLQLGGWQLPSQELHGGTVHTTGRPRGKVTMKAGSPAKSLLVRVEGVSLVDEKLGFWSDFEVLFKEGTTLWSWCLNQDKAHLSQLHFTHWRRLLFSLDCHKTILTELQIQTSLKTCCYSWSSPPIVLHLKDIRNI